MAQQEADANKAIQAWESQVAQLQEELTALKTEQTPMQGDSTVTSLEGELAAERVRHKEARGDTEALKVELAETRSVVERLTEQIEGELFGVQEARQEIMVLTRSLDESRTESEMVIGQWRGG
jgi:chromosome segregation ATPase